MAEDPIYIVSIEMSSPNRIVNTHELNAYESQTRYYYEKIVRRRIGAVRARYKTIQYDSCLKVFTLYVCRESVRTRIISTIQNADREMKVIDSNLYARVLFFPLSRESIKESEMWEQLRNAIKTQVYGTMLERIQAIAQKENIPTKSIRALVRMCDELQDINVLDDNEVTQRIASIRANIERRMLSPIVAELETEVNGMESIFSYVEPEDIPQAPSEKVTHIDADFSISSIPDNAGDEHD